MIGLIAACNFQHVIGVNGRVPWRSSVDMKRFQNLTMGCPVIMGRTTWNSLPKPLPGRHNIVLTRDISEQETGIIAKASDYPFWVRLGIYESLAEAIEEAKKQNFGKTVWIIGGESVYREALLTEAADFIDLTFIPDPIDLTTYGDQTLRVNYFPFEEMGKGYNIASSAPNKEDPSIRHTRLERW